MSLDSDYYDSDEYIGAYDTNDINNAQQNYNSEEIIEDDFAYNGANDSDLDNIDISEFDEPILYVGGEYNNASTTSNELINLFSTEPTEITFGGTDYDTSNNESNIIASDDDQDVDPSDTSMHDKQKNKIGSNDETITIRTLNDALKTNDNSEISFTNAKQDESSIDHQPKLSDFFKTIH